MENENHQSLLSNLKVPNLRPLKFNKKVWACVSFSNQDIYTHTQSLALTGIYFECVDRPNLLGNPRFFFK